MNNFITGLLIAGIVVSIAVFFGSADIMTTETGDKHEQHR